jgi:predicted metal-dependent HD superfamily phosphohydrolase
MGDSYLLLAEKAAMFVSHLFETPHLSSFPYHNILHTKKVAEHCSMLSRFYSLDEKDHSIVLISAWFHDIGQIYGDMKGHEQRGVEIMKIFMGNFNTTADFTTVIESCILATATGSTPGSLPEIILRDADTWHFGTIEFRKTEFLVKAEMELRTGRQFHHWHSQRILMLENHVYYTDYCQLHLVKGKKENINWLRSLNDA